MVIETGIFVNLIFLDEKPLLYLDVKLPQKRGMEKLLIYKGQDPS